MLDGLGLGQPGQREDGQDQEAGDKLAPPRPESRVHFFPFFFFFAHFTRSGTCSLWTALSWATNLALATCGCRQVSVALVIKLWSPPRSDIVNLVSGASGSRSKRARRPPLKESILPSASTSMPRPLSAATRSGSLRSLPFERR